MMRISAAVFIIASAFLFMDCKKNDDRFASGSESELYGAWAMGPGPADTLYFLRKNNKNIMRHLEGINAGLPRYSELEYKFGDGKLSLQYYSLNEYHAIPSFQWTQGRTEFQVLAIQLFGYISSSTAIFTYRKT